MKVLVTGAGGYIGTELTKRFQEAGIAFDRVIRNEQLSTPFKSHQDGWEVQWPHGLTLLAYDEYDAVIHLAYGKPPERASFEEAIEHQLIPVRNIVEACTQQRVSPHLIFVSSQSASPSTKSPYGRGKYVIEEFLSNSSIPWSVLRPGLIIDKRGGGFFGTLQTVISKLPLVGVPTSSSLMIQPVARRDVVEGIITLLRNTDRFNRKILPLALSPRPLISFVREVRDLQSPKTVVFGVPERVVRAALAMLEYCMTTPPLTRVHLEGLLGGQPLSKETSEQFLGRPLLSVGDALQEHRTLSHSLTTNKPELTTDEEAAYLFSSLFNRQIPPSVVEAYHQAHAFIPLEDTDEVVKKIVLHKLDVEALEYALRQKGTVLTKKCLLLTYLAELDPSFLPHFYNSKRSPIKGMAVLGVHVLRAGWKYLIGRFLLWKFQLHITTPS